MDLRQVSHFRGKFLAKHKQAISDFTNSGFDGTQILSRDAVWREAVSVNPARSKGIGTSEAAHHFASSKYEASLATSEGEFAAHIGHLASPPEPSLAQPISEQKQQARKRSVTQASDLSKIQ